jgi:hypothetical protein
MCVYVCCNAIAGNFIIIIFNPADLPQIDIGEEFAAHGGLLTLCNMLSQAPQSLQVAALDVLAAAASK